MTLVSDRGADFVGGWEGFRSCPYRDAVGVWTIGYGTTSATGHHVGPDTDCIDRAKARRWLAEELNGHYNASRLVPGIDFKQREVDALSSFAYNNGPGAVADPSFSTLARLLRTRRAKSYWWRKRWYKQQLPRWVFAGGVRLEGLVKRRAAEVALAVRGDYSGRP